MKYYCEDSAEVLKEVESSEGGLSSDEAQKRLARDGRNANSAVLVRFWYQSGTDNSDIGDSSTWFQQVR